MLWTPGYDNHSRWLNLIRNDRPEVFLDRFIFRGYRSDIDAVGFKVFPSHAQDPRFEHLINFVIGDPKVRVVHLYRNNKLAVYASLARARRSGVWATRAKGRGPSPAVVLDPDECASGLAELEEQERYFRRILKNRPHLQVSYEELTEAPDEHYHRILEHIGLAPEAMRLLTVKQSPRRLEDAVANFAELAQRFSGTPFGRYFERTD